MPEKQNIEWKAIWKDEYLQWLQVQQEKSNTFTVP